MKYGPKKEDSPSLGKACPACDKPFVVGDYTTLVALGPGDDPESQMKCVLGRPYNAVALEIHYTCAYGSLDNNPT